MKILFILALFALCPTPKEYILYDVVYKDYCCPDGAYRYEKYLAARFTYNEALKMQIVLWNRSEYCDGPTIHDSPIVIEHVNQKKPTPNPWR